MTALAAALALASALVGRDAPSGGMGPPGVQPTPAGGAERQTYLTGYASGALELRPVDPRTLADLPDRPPLRVPDLDYGNFTWLVSADGSTIAVLQYSGALAQAGDVTIRIIEARSGAERARFRAPVPVEMQYLTADGSRLFGWGPAYRQEPQRRFLWDTADGRLLATLPLTAPFGEAYDAGARRAYALVAPDWRDGGLQPATLVAQDGASGREVGRVPLDGVGMGQQAGGLVQPRVILSPDGRRVAVLHADGQALTLIDAGTLRPLWTRPLARAAGVPDRSQPRPVEGKALQQTAWLLAISPDGRRLYTYGVEAWVVDVGRIAYRPLGLRAIDVGRAEVVAEVGQDRRLEWFSLSPTGDALYTFGPRPGAPEIGGPSLVRRLDPLTLAITAEREVANPGSRGVVSLVAATGSRR